MGVLGLTDTAAESADRREVTDAVTTWGADELETAIVAAGGCAAAALRTPGE